MPRLFIAVNIPEEIKKELARFQQKLTGIISNGFVPPENIHITLKFLGEVSEEQVPIIKAVCSEALSLPKFEVLLKGAGVFPSKNFVRIIWAGIDAGANKLTWLREKLDEKLDPLGFKDPHAFRAHTTVVRVKYVENRNALGKLIDNNRSTEFGKFEVNRISIMKSTLKSSGAEYEEIAHVTLA